MPLRVRNPASTDPLFEQLAPAAAVPAGSGGSVRFGTWIVRRVDKRDNGLSLWRWRMPNGTRRKLLWVLWLLLRFCGAVIEFGGRVLDLDRRCGGLGGDNWRRTR